VNNTLRKASINDDVFVIPQTKFARKLIDHMLAIREECGPFANWLL
jgi:hypothetical protein